MAENKKRISDLPELKLEEIEGSEALPIGYYGKGRRISLSTIRSYIGGSGGGGSVNLTSVDSNILPKKPRTYSLGNSANNWLDAHIGGVLYLGSSMISGFADAEDESQVVIDSKVYAKSKSGFSSRVLTESDVDGYALKTELKLTNDELASLQVSFGSALRDINRLDTDVSGLKSNMSLLDEEVENLGDRVTIFEDNYIHKDSFQSWTDRIEQNEKDIAGLESNYDGFMQEFVDVARDLEARKADKSTVYTNTEMDAKLGDYATTSSVKELTAGVQMVQQDLLSKIGVKADKSYVDNNFVTNTRAASFVEFGSSLQIDEGVITINGTSIKPLTSHQSLYSLTLKDSVGNTMFTYDPKTEPSGGNVYQLTKSMVGLGNVENTKLSTWGGSTNITKLGTITSGTWNGSKIGQSYLDLSGYAKSSDLDSYLKKTSLSFGTGLVNDNFSVGVNTEEIATRAWVEDKNYLTGITSAQVTNALGFTPQNVITAGDGISFSSNVVSVDNTIARASDLSIYAKSSDLGPFAKKNSLAASDIPDLSGTYQTKITSTNKLSSSLVSGLGAASGYGVSEGNFTASDGNLVVGAAVYSHVTNRLKGYATQDWVEGKKYLTSYTEQYTGTITGITMNGASKGTSGVVDLGTVITSHQSIYALTIKDSSGTTKLTYTPNSAAGSITLSSAMVGLGNINSLIGDTYLTSASFTNANIKSTLGISDWALATSKPTYSKNEITNALGYTPYNATNPNGYYKSGDSPTFNTITLNGNTLTLGSGITLNDKNLAVKGSISEGGTLLSSKYQPIGDYQPAGDYLTSANIGTAINNAIANYGFATVATSGSYNDLSNKPTSLPASDVYAWAKATRKPSYSWSEITSTPTFATVATSGSYNDLSNKPTLGSLAGLSSVGEGQLDRNLLGMIQGKADASALDNYAQLGTDVSFNKVTVNGVSLKKLSSIFYIGDYMTMNDTRVTITKELNAKAIYEDGKSLSSVYQAKGSYVTSSDLSGYVSKTQGTDGRYYIKLDGGIENNDRGWTLRIGTNYFAHNNSYAVYDAVYAETSSWTVHLGTPNRRWASLYVGEVNQSSDAAMKNVLGDIGLTTSQIANAPAVGFTWKHNGKKDIGTLAQYWKDVLPEIVSGEEGNMGMNYAALGVVSSIILARNVETHEQRIERLEREITNLQNELDELRENSE